MKKRETSKGAKAEMSKLAHKLKRERKGARKEIRQDAAFLAKTKAQEDRERWVLMEKEKLLGRSRLGKGEKGCLFLFPPFHFPLFSLTPQFFYPAVASFSFPLPPFFRPT